MNGIERIWINMSDKTAERLKEIREGQRKKPEHPCSNTVFLLDLIEQLEGENEDQAEVINYLGAKLGIDPGDWELSLGGAKALIKSLLNCTTEEEWGDVDDGTIVEYILRLRAALEEVQPELKYLSSVYKYKETVNGIKIRMVSNIVNEALNPHSRKE